jgi:CBS domain-containing protein
MVKKISDIMTKRVYSLSAADTIKDAAQLMKSRDIGFVPIVSGKSLLGVVTDRDLVLRGYARGLGAETRLGEVMTSACVTAHADASVEEVAGIMAKNQIRRICVLENGNLAGVCSLGDISTSYYGKTEAGEALSEISKEHYAGN